MDFANRDDPIPVVSISPPNDDHDHPNDNHLQPRPNAPKHRSKREALRHSLSSDKLKGKLEEKIETFCNPSHSRSRSDSMSSSQSSQSSSKLQDRVMETLLKQMIGPVADDDGGGNDDDAGSPKDRRSRKYVDRPGFNLATMGYNFRRFNARVGILFVFENRLIRLFSWKDPTHTLSFLAVYSFAVLDPHLLAVLPLAACLFFIMVPAYLARHPPPPTHGPTDIHDFHGPPIRPPQNIKPAPELSKDFWRNMRDLQNAMEDFSSLHDAAITYLAPPTNFSNEALSSAVYIVLFISACALFVVAQVLPWRLVLLVGGWVAICSLHPRSQAFLTSTHVDEFVQHQGELSKTVFETFVVGDVDLAPGEPELREVEIFELQRRVGDSPKAIYEHFVFSTSPYTPLSQDRVAGDRPRGSRFFEDVEPPKGWRWADKKWSLDLSSREWVEERCITGVEVEVEGERWVTDIHYDEEFVQSIADDAPAISRAIVAGGVTMANGAGESTDSLDINKLMAKKEVKKSWEEGTGTGKKGPWRRRRWARLVQRRPLPPPEDLYLSTAQA
ncbi:integral peroxisomal membrane peroxin-domain-containing protein [Phyllosticta citricarpa]|uniref:Integral peroxisomal membrane peroxin-domain-containing protein n=1 Tax=Phyllosticta citricarpa TaxID=55181 RepID=A0ABR1LE69_9PEZI